MPSAYHICPPCVFYFRESPKVGPFKICTIKIGATEVGPSKFGTS